MNLLIFLECRDTSREIYRLKSILRNSGCEKISINMIQNKSVNLNQLSLFGIIERSITKQLINNKIWRF